MKVLNRDLKAAGIPKVDERGRTVDVHAMRTTFATMHSKGKVSPKVAQLAMRHSDIRLTMEIYTDPKLLDVAGSLNSLPALNPAKDSGSTKESQDEASQSDDESWFVPLLVPNVARVSPKRSSGVKSASKAKLLTDEPDSEQNRMNPTK